jgi:hypothetical protein
MRRLLAAGLFIAVAAGCEKSPTDTPGPSRNYEVGGVYQFNVRTTENCANPDYRDGRVVAISQRAIVVADTQNPTGAGTFSDDEYREFGREFDTRVWPVVTQNFGEPHDVDGNSRVIIFFTRAVNELTPRGQSWYIGGFFHPRDLFPQQRASGFDACPGSNYAEMMYMLVPDPNGAVNGNRRTKDRELRGTINVLAHELQHLVNSSRRLYVVRAGGSEWTEEAWLNEGLSHIAEELMGYAYPNSTLSARQNITADRLNSFGSTDRAAFINHQLSNFDRLEQYFRNPAATSLIGPADSLNTRGATWQFLRYAADRRGGSESVLWRQLVDSNRRGLPNLQAAIGVDPMQWINDWSVAIFADDAVANAAPEFRQASWNFRSVYSQFRNDALPRWGRYPLDVKPLSEGTETADIPAAGAVYYRFEVLPNTRGELRFGSASGECQTVTLAVGQVHRLPGDQARALCFDGGSTRSEYALIPFFVSGVGAERLSFSVTASGIVRLAEPTAGHAASHGDGLLGDASAVRAMDPARQWEAQFRERAEQELSRLVPGGSAARQHTGSARLSTTLQTATTSDPRLLISLVRTQ